MGFNISGLVINQNYKDNFDELKERLGWKLEKQADINFEIASSNWKEENVCDVYFTENGTLLFLPMDMCEESFTLKANNTLTFALSETSMVFHMVYCENGVDKRTILEIEGERITNEGESLEVEEKSEDPSEIIWNQMSELLGQSFWKIDADEKAERYTFVKESKTNQESKVEETTETHQNTGKERTNKIDISRKNWWKFWK